MKPQPLPAKRYAVKGAHAETFLLLSLTTFAATVLLTRLFLQLTGYPQLGNSELHIAHALWGGLFLIIASIFPLVLVNRWAFSISAILSGVGIGLFIDEIGKFITQRNDYFYPPAAPLIYSFFLLLLLVYMFVRKRSSRDPRGELYRAFSHLGELADNNLDQHELETLLGRLKIARQSDLPQVAGLAAAVETYLREDNIPLVPATPDTWDRFLNWLKKRGERLGRKRHRYLIVVAMSLMGLWVLLTLAVLLLFAFWPDFSLLVSSSILSVFAETHGTIRPIWSYLRLVLDLAISLMALYSAYLLGRGKDLRGIRIALLALMLSLTGVLLLSFYLDQFSAVTKALYQFVVLLSVMAYRRWYLTD
jgi:hypothetical protein